MTRFLIGGLSALMLTAAPLASAEADGYARDPRRVAPLRAPHPRHARPARRLLPPEIPYRAPDHAGPPEIIHAYLPRLTTVPIYNEPPPHYPEP